jgi:uncharacterized membrane protein YccC
MVRLLYRLPSHVLNGASVSLGVSFVYLATFLFGGTSMALAAASGAVYASLADVPNAPTRTWRRVLTSGAIGSVVTLLVAVLRPYPVALVVAVAGIGFVSSLALAWGARANAIAFVFLMSFVFTLATPATDGWRALFFLGGSVALGAVLYLAWAWTTSVLLRSRYRTLALVEVLTATAQLLRSRATLLAADRRPLGALPMKTFIADECVLDDQLQIARDLVFAAIDENQAQRQTALLLLAVELRDRLLVGQLDLELLGHDILGERMKRALVGIDRAMADTLDSMTDALRWGQSTPARIDAGGALRELASIEMFDSGDKRRSLLPVLIERAQQKTEILAQMRGLMHGASHPQTLTRDELQLFVSVEGWPLAALRPHLTLASPVFRHAVRSAVALSAAYLIGLVLPWSSHPYWLVMAVGVVLRGSLEQTQMRRNARVAGTATGCVIVLLLAPVVTPWLVTLVFLFATGLAHSFAVKRYFVTAAAATVMALLQDNLANPLGGFAVGERLADTIIGALLAWAFSYALPSWEREGLPRIVARLMRALEALAEQAVHLPRHRDAEVALRLARREVYDAMRGIALAAQRSRVEPQRVRVPIDAFADLLAHSHALMAQLAAARVLLARGASELDRHEVEAMLIAAAADIRRQITQQPGAASAHESALDEANVELPARSPTEALMPWLQRRLRRAATAAGHAAASAAALTAAATSTA